MGLRVSALRVGTGRLRVACSSGSAVGQPEVGSGQVRFNITRPKSRAHEGQAKKTFNESSGVRESRANRTKACAQISNELEGASDSE